jgi:hypothetical protein
MRVLLDKTVCDVQVDSVEDAIAAAADLAQQRGRMIVEVIIDGRTWTQVDLADASSLSSCEEVHLTSADPAELVAQTFSQAGDALREADQLQQTAAELIQADHMPQAMDKLSEALNIWSSVQQAVSMGAEVAGLDLATEIASAGLEGVIDRLNSHLKTIRTSLESRDPVGLADTLLYELPEMNVQWRGLLESLGRRVAENNRTAR